MKFLIAIIFITLTTTAHAAALGDQFTHFMGFSLNNDAPLKEVQTKLGLASFVEKGEGGNYEISLCYKIDKTYLQFRSGEMGGPSHELLGFTLSEKPPNDTCVSPKSKINNSDLTFGSLHLGMSKAQYLIVTKENTKIYKNLRAIFQNKLPMTAQQKKKFSEADLQGQDYYDVSIMLTPSFVDDHLTKIDVWKITTY